MGRNGKRSYERNTLSRSAGQAPLSGTSRASEPLTTGYTVHHRVFHIISQAVPGAIPKCFKWALGMGNLG